MCQKERMRDIVKRDRRDFRQDKMERAARKDVWHELYPVLKAAKKAETEAKIAMEEKPTPQTRRKYLAAKIYRLALEEQGRRCWM